MSSQRPQILVVEDEKPHQLIVQKVLGGHYDLVFAGSVHEAKTLIAQASPYDLILLDIMLGDGTGFEVLSQLRQHEKYRLTPVVFLTVREDTKSKLLGFSLGADDYVTKPADPLELRARIESKLRKMIEMRDQNAMGPMTIGDFNLDPERQALWVKEEGKNQSFDLTPLEFRLFLFLSKHMDRPLTRQEILDHVWGTSTHVLDRSVDSYVAALRRKLGARGKYIKSVHGVGYRLTVPTAAPLKRAA